MAVPDRKENKDEQRQNENEPEVGKSVNEVGG
jgi:hypothetical protein